MTPETNSTPNASVLRLNDADRNRLGEVLRELLAHGSIMGLEPGKSDIYDWCRQNPDCLREMTALLGFAVFSEHESRLAQVVPQSSSLTLRLRQDATLVLLALWYELDTQVRDNGATEVRLTVEELNQLLKEKLMPDLKSQPSAGRMREILAQARRFNLIRVDLAEPFEQSRIEILPTLKKVIQFNGIEDWNKTAELHRNPTVEVSDAEATGEGEEETP